MLDFSGWIMCLLIALLFFQNRGVAEKASSLGHQLFIEHQIKEGKIQLAIVFEVSPHSSLDPTKLEYSLSVKDSQSEPVQPNEESFLLSGKMYTLSESKIFLPPNSKLHYPLSNIPLLLGKKRPKKLLLSSDNRLGHFWFLEEEKEYSIFFNYKHPTIGTGTIMVQVGQPGEENSGKGAIQRKVPIQGKKRCLEPNVTEDAK